MEWYLKQRLLSHKNNPLILAEMNKCSSINSVGLGYRRDDEFPWSKQDIEVRTFDTDNQNKKNFVAVEMMSLRGTMTDSSMVGCASQQS